jgi:predicted GH43/DUF377 family glycosyl hydrolase
VSALFATRFAWKRHGLVIRPTGEPWMVTHAMVPTPDRIGGSLYRLYFSGRDERNRSHVSYAVIDLEDPTRVLETAPAPCLSPGELGTFDDNGVTPSCLIRDGREQRLYYIGWDPGSTVRVHLFGGLAVSVDGGRTFVRWSRAPILERTREDPFLNTAPWVIREDDGWRMYYVAGLGWDAPDAPRYHIRTATSHDGRSWLRTGQVCLDLRGPEETALARPYVIRDRGVFRMWLSHRGDTYRIGYAESADGVTWIRDDAHGGLDVSTSPFEDRMIEYAAVVPHRGSYVMFYNGNDYGREGAAVAISE